MLPVVQIISDAVAERLYCVNQGPSHNSPPRSAWCAAAPGHAGDHWVSATLAAGVQLDHEDQDPDDDNHGWFLTMTAIPITIPPIDG